jgi:hypothetical protein
MIGRVPDGILVSLHTRLHGGVTYQRRDLGGDQIVDGQRVVSRWETTKIVTDAAELAAASSVRSAAGYLIRRVCVPTRFGLVCPLRHEAELRQAIDEARRLVDEHNRQARHARVELGVLCGRVDGSAAETVRAIAQELGSVLGDLQGAADRGDVAQIREAATRARGLVAILPADLAAQVEQIVETARAQAREIRRDGETSRDVVPLIQAAQRVIRVRARDAREEVMS